MAQNLFVLNTKGFWARRLIPDSLSNALSGSLDLDLSKVGCWLNQRGCCQKLLFNTSPFIRLILNSIYGSKIYGPSMSDNVMQDELLQNLK